MMPKDGFMSQEPNKEAPDLIELQRIAAALADCTIGHTLHYYASVTSTMTVAQELARQDDLLSGAVVIADEQRSGRGRMDRRWEAPAGRALLLSIILKPPHLPNEPGHLAMIAGLAIIHALDAYGLTDGLQAGLKWPNDVLLGRERVHAEKLGGVLIESAFTAGGWQSAIVGCGVNVNQMREELPPVLAPAPSPTSLRVGLGRSVSRTELLIALCRAWERLLAWSSFQLVTEWRSRLWTLDRSVRLHLADNAVLEGTAVDVTDDGSLILEDGSGRQHVITAGDVTLRMADR